MENETNGPPYHFTNDDMAEYRRKDNEEKRDNLKRKQSSVGREGISERKRQTLERLNRPILISRIAKKLGNNLLEGGSRLADWVADSEDNEEVIRKVLIIFAVIFGIYYGVSEFIDRIFDE